MLLMMAMAVMAAPAPSIGDSLSGKTWDVQWDEKGHRGSYTGTWEFNKDGTAILTLGFCDPIRGEWSIDEDKQFLLWKPKSAYRWHPRYNGAAVGDGSYSWDDNVGQNDPGSWWTVFWFRPNIPGYLAKMRGLYPYSTWPVQLSNPTRKP